MKRPEPCETGILETEKMMPHHKRGRKYLPLG